MAHRGHQSRPNLFITKRKQEYMLGALLTLVAISLFMTNRYYSSLLIFLGLLTQGFLVVPADVLLAGLPVDKTADLSLLYILAIGLLRFRTLRRAFQHEPPLRWILAFILFVFADALYSRFVLGYDLPGVLRVFRHNLFYLSFSIFLMVPARDLLRVWHTVAKITLVQCVLYLLQIPTGMVLLGDPSSTTINNMEAIGWIRYYNLPTFLIPTLFFYLFVRHHRSQTVRWCIIGLLLITVIAPMHRSYILVVVAVASVYILSQQTTSKRFIYVALLVIVGNGAMMTDSVQSRMNDGLADLNKALAPGSNLAKSGYDQSDTFSYRMVHLTERVSYVVENPARLLFGVGLLSEDTKQASKLSFQAGLFNQRTGQVSQVDTGDIAWSLLILYMGVAGVFFFVVLHVRLFRYFLRYRTIPISVVGSLTLATVFLLSFTGTEILQNSFRVSVMLLLGLVVKEVRSSASASTPSPTHSPYTVPFAVHHIYSSVDRSADRTGPAKLPHESFSH